MVMSLVLSLVGPAIQKIYAQHMAQQEMRLLFQYVRNASTFAYRTESNGGDNGAKTTHIGACYCCWAVSGVAELDIFDEDDIMLRNNTQISPLMIDTKVGGAITSLITGC